MERPPGMFSQQKQCEFDPHPLRAVETISRVRVAIVADQPVTRCGLEWVLGRAAGLAVVAAVGSPAELWEAGGVADVVVLDLNPATGLVPAGEIGLLARTAAVLVFSASADEAHVRAAVDAGAHGYVVKSSTVSVCVEAVQVVGTGGRHLPPGLVDPPGAPAAALRLAPREREALTLIARGFTQAQAAARMGVSAATVDTYLTRIRTKLGPGNKADLTRRALELGELAPPRRRDCAACAGHVGRVAA